MILFETVLFGTHIDEYNAQLFQNVLGDNNQGDKTIIPAIEELAQIL